MSRLPEYSIDLSAFHADPYPTYARLRKDAPIAYVPELNAVLFTKRDDISINEKKIALFSSEQPDGLMNKLMGINMMRRDGDPHAVERKAVFPTISPKTARDVWSRQFQETADALIEGLVDQGRANLMQDFAAILSGEALKITTGLTHVSATDIDRWSQAMIDGIANYTGDPQVENNCKRAVQEIDQAVETAPPSPFPTLINSQKDAGLPDSAIAANVRLAISGGQNETRDAISGIIWALLTHPDQHASITSNQKTYRDAFEEYVRWIAPIGMSPRRATQDVEINGTPIPKDARVFFMFASANRDEDVFPNPDQFDLTQDASRHIAFGAGPHFCAGAAIAKAVVADIALPTLFGRIPELELQSDVHFEGWAFRGPTSLDCKW